MDIKIGKFPEKKSIFSGKAKFLFKEKFRRINFRKEIRQIRKFPLNKIDPKIEG